MTHREAAETELERMSGAEMNADAVSKLRDEVQALEKGHASDWPPAAPGHWSWPPER
jgi:hypothetical protein